MRPASLLGAFSVTGAILLAGAGCTRTIPPRAPLQVADEHFARGEHRGAGAAYELAIAQATNPDERARARFFQLLSRRSDRGPAEFDSVIKDLRALSVEAAGTRWGRLAGLYADEMGQANSLRWALQRAGADVASLQSKLAELEATLEGEQQLAAEQAAQLQALKDERAQLQRAIHERDERLAARSAAVDEVKAAVDEVKAELDALKQIDLSRGP